MITDVEYLQLVNEAYDLSDYRTKRHILFCNEAQKSENIEHIVGKLYMHIKNNCAGIDFGTIPKSKGIVTKVDNYTELVDCISVLHDLVSSYHENTGIVDEMSTALNNVQKRERLFTKAFALGIEFPMMLYNSTVLSIVAGVSLLITSSVEYIKNGHDSFAMSFDKTGYIKTKDHVLYEYVVQFNRNCDKGVIDKLINECIKNNLTATNESTEMLDEISNTSREHLRGIASTVASGTGAAVLGFAAADGAGKFGTVMSFLGDHKVLKLITVIIAIGIFAIQLMKHLKDFVYFALKMSMSVSDWADAQATFLQINAENALQREGDEDTKKRVYQKQMKWVEKFRKLSNTFAIKNSKAKKDVSDQNRNEEKERYNDGGSSTDGSYSDDGGLF